MVQWKKVRIQDIGTVVGGATPSTKIDANYKNGHISWITPKDLSTFNGRYIYNGERNITEMGLNSSSTVLMPKNSILFSSRAPIGYVAIAGKELCTNQGFKSVIPNRKIDYLFLYYLLKYNKNKIENLGSGTTFKEVSGSVMKNVEVMIPEDIKEQKRIAAVLNSIDDKIELNNEINDNLANQVKSLYEDIINDLDIKNLPSGFKLITLSDIAEVQSGKRPNSRTEKSDEINIYPLVGAASIMGFTNNYNFDEKILITGRVGTHGVIQRFSSPCWASDNTLIITSNYYEFTSQVLQHIDYRSLNRGSTQPLITQSDLKKQQIILPDLDTLNRFEESASSLMALYDQNLISNKELAELRDSLLPKLMSGEIDVDSIEL